MTIIIVSLCYINFKNKQEFFLLKDTVVTLTVSSLSVGEEDESFEICIDSGIVGSFETALTVSLSSIEGKASELLH